jgi:hypothetical protein
MSTHDSFDLNISITGLCVLAFNKKARTIEAFMLSAKAAAQCNIETHYPRLYFKRGADSGGMECVSLEHRQLDLSAINGVPGPPMTLKDLNHLAWARDPKHPARRRKWGMIDIQGRIPVDWRAAAAADLVGARVCIRAEHAVVDCTGAMWYYPIRCTRRIGHTVTFTRTLSMDESPVRLQLTSILGKDVGLDLGELTPIKDRKTRQFAVNLSLKNVALGELGTNPGMGSPGGEELPMPHFPAYLQLLTPNAYPVPIEHLPQGDPGRGSFITCTAAYTSESLPARRHGTASRRMPGM